METKQVIVVRKDLNMRKGKIASQVAHASLAVILGIIKEGRIVYKYGMGWMENDHTYKPVTHWLNGSFTKICVYVNSEQELLDIFRKVHETKIPRNLIEDEGRTEFNGIPTHTCLAIGPWTSSEIDKFTKHLPLL
jgi:peptidyl-tRNA hydrolase, PTH2 family